MSVFHFAFSTLHLPASLALERHRLACEIDPRAGFSVARMPEGPRSWGYAPNRGDPFDSRLASRIERAWVAAGVGGTKRTPITASPDLPYGEDLATCAWEEARAIARRLGRRHVEFVAGVAKRS